MSMLQALEGFETVWCLLKPVGGASCVGPSRQAFWFWTMDKLTEHTNE